MNLNNSKHKKCKCHCPVSEPSVSPLHSLSCCSRGSGQLGVGRWPQVVGRVWNERGAGMWDPLETPGLENRSEVDLLGSSASETTEKQSTLTTGSQWEISSPFLKSQTHPMTFA